MTSRERVQCVLRGEIPDRVPFNFWMDRDLMAEYDRRWGHDFRITHYGADVVEAFVALPWWADLPMKTVDDGKTLWQVEPLIERISDACDLTLPDPSSADVYADIEAKRTAYPDKAIFALMLAPLDILQPLRLAEHLYLDIYDHPDDIHRILRRVRPVLEEAARHTCALDIDVLYLAGDLCGRDGPLVSPSHLREFVFDYLVGVIEIAHAAGKKVFYHSDGLVLPILDMYIEYGLDGCNPVEPRFNDAREFVRRTNGRLILYGGLDNCRIIPDGSVQDVRNHVRSQFEMLGREGRLIFSTHDIPSHCPLENLDAMVEEIKSCP